MNTAERLKLHKRAVMVLDALHTIEAVAHADLSPKHFRAHCKQHGRNTLDALRLADKITYETEARLTLCPLSGGAR